MDSTGNDIALRSRFEAYLASKGMRKTQERFVILEAACAMGGHFDADTLHRRLEADTYHVSLATVYNTLELLRRAGILACHTFKSRQSQYEFADADEGHMHLVCSQCGKVREVPDAELSQAIAQRRFGSFSATSFSIEIFGICASCVRQNRKNKNNKTNPQNSNGKS